VAQYFAVRDSFGRKRAMKTFFSPTTYLVLLLMCLSPFGYAQTDVEKLAAESSQTLIKNYVAWKTKLSSPGASIRAKEIGREGSIVRYNLYVSGIPNTELYTAITWPVGQAKPSPLMEGVTIGKDGIVICAGRTPEQCGSASKKDDPIDFIFLPTKGEPYRIALFAGNDRVAVAIVPDPIIGKDKGCTLTVERLLPHFELAFITGSGFRPNSDVSFDSQSYDEKHPVKTVADGDGNIQFALMPFVSGHKKGTTTVKGVGMTCSPSIKFDWGG
jgi:hypothetical protein